MNVNFEIIEIDVDEVFVEYGDVIIEDKGIFVCMDGFDDFYEILSVIKFDGNCWCFNVCMKYMSVDVMLLVVVLIEWVGDILMVLIIDFEIFGFGNEFGVCVVFYDGCYVGIWDYGEVGGLMYGMIEKFE